jgi:hypothetical protein
VFDPCRLALGTGGSQHDHRDDGAVDVGHPGIEIANDVTAEPLTTLLVGVRETQPGK